MYYSVDIFFRNVHHLSDARFAAGIWAKWISFNFDQTSKDYISPLTVAEIIPWVSGPEILAEFGESNTKENITEVCELLKINSILISKDRGPELSDLDLNMYHKEAFSRDLNSSDYQFYPISMEEDMELNENVKTIALEGVFEEKPGAADYESLSLFLEKLED